MLSEDKVREYGGELYEALRSRQAVEPITMREQNLSIDDAYHISEHMRQRREADGEQVIGKKIGITSTSVQSMLNVHQPDFGYLTDAMVYGLGDSIPISRELIQPRIEGEVAFLLKRDLTGPGVNNADVLCATELVLPCFEVVDSRIRDWNIKIQDTVADNASCGLFVLGDRAAPPSQVDFALCGLVLERNGEVVATGAGAAALGSPVNCVTWLANTLGRFGVALKAGEIVLSGSLVPLQPIAAGDTYGLEINGIGACSARFV